MNQARTIGSALSKNKYTSHWIYMIAPVLSVLLDAWSYDMIRLNDKLVREITKTRSFLKSLRSNPSNRVIFSNLKYISANKIEMMKFLFYLGFTASQTASVLGKQGFSSCQSFCFL
jgi:hypothetical protein